jgi:ribosomal protein S18 acetylase RimI-like enzyme
MTAVCFHRSGLDRNIMDEVQIILEKSFDMAYEDEYFMENENYMHFYAIHDGKVVSYLTYNAYESTIYNVCTSPEKRRRGYTKTLLRYAIDTVENDTVFLYVDEWNMSARWLYEKLGFTYIFKGRDELLMRHKRGWLTRLLRFLSCKN